MAKRNWIQFRIDDELKQLFQDYALKQERSMSQILLEDIRRMVDAQ